MIDKENLNVEIEDGDDEEVLITPPVKTPAKDPDDGDEEGDDGDEDSGQDEGEGEDDSSGDEEAQAEPQESEEALEAKREARRQERRARKERERIRRQQDQNLINELRNEVDTLKKIAFDGHKEKIRERIGVLKATYDGSKQALVEAEAEISRATQNNDGQALVEAMRNRDSAIAAMRSASNEYRTIVENVSKTADPRAGQEAQNGRDAQANVSPVALTKFVEWNNKHPWFNLKSTDRDSAAVRFLDNQIMEAGYDPETSEYWEELTTRVKATLPHRFKKTDAVKKSPPTQPSGSTASPNGKKFALSAERVNAMKEAGIWDDPEKRKKMIERYAAYDKQNPQGAQ